VAERSVLVRLQANITDFRNQMRQAEDTVDRVRRRTQETEEQATTMAGRLTQSARQNRQAWDDGGRALATFGAVTVAALGATVKAAIDWESAWAGVTKTVDGSEKELQVLEDGLRNLARTLPSTHGEIAAVAEAAGQLGVKTNDIVSFTRVMIDLGQTTNLSADQAATSLAQLMNVMKTSPDDVGRLGAALVALGNAGASTEADILNMASFITGSARLIGASESDVLALANAMTSMGINAERGGGVMTRVMQDIYAAVQTGGAKLEGFASVAGMSASQFAAAFKDDPVRAIDSFIQGLNNVEASGGNVVATLSDLGYKGTQDTAVLLQMKGAGDLLTQSLDLGNQAWQDNTALVNEAAKRYETTSSQIAIARNNINDAAITIGDTFLPVIGSLADSVAAVAGWFSDLPTPIQGGIGALTGVTGVAALAGGAFLLLFPRVIDTVTAFRTLSRTNPGVASGLGKVAKAAGVVALAFTAYQAITASNAEATDSMTDSIVNGGKSLDDLRAKLNEAANTSNVSKFFGGLALRQYWDDDFGPTMAANFEEAQEAAGKLWRAMTPLEQAGQKQAEWTRTLASRLAEYGPEAEETRIAQERLAYWTNAAADAQTELDGATADASAQLAQAALAGQNGYESLDNYAIVLGLSEDATKELRDRTNELGSSLGEFIQPLGAYTDLLEEKRTADEEAARATAEATASQSDSWEDYVTDVGVSLEEYMGRLQEQLTAQTDWQTNMLILAGRVSQGTLDELARMGPEGATLVAQLVNGTDAQMDQLDVLFAARSAEATAAWGEQLFLAAPVLSQIAATAGNDVAAALAAQLQAGTITVAQIADQYGITLAGGINPILQALGKPQIVVTAEMRATNPYYANRAEGGVVDYYAAGGVRENHVAEIAPAGDWRVWAEPETGGEAYIPLAPGKRTRSLEIWRETGRRLGEDMQAFAFGGINDVPAVPSTDPFRSPLSTSAQALMERARTEATAWLAANLEPPRASGGSSTGLLPIMAAARQYVTDTYGVGNIGGFARRNIAGTNQLSDHALGKAIDIMTSNLQLGWTIANDFAYGPAHDRFRAENVIWQQSISSNGGPFKGMADRGSPTQNHRDHVHVDTFAKGGIRNPHVRDNGGPLLPGYTFNGTGAGEIVVDPRHYAQISQLMAAGAASPTTVMADVRVYLGNRELTDIVRVEINGERTTSRRGAVAASVAAGTLR
jgi:TP901 family phage tail tape measure protein